MKIFSIAKINNFENIVKVKNSLLISEDDENIIFLIEEVFKYVENNLSTLYILVDNDTKDICGASVISLTALNDTPFIYINFLMLKKEYRKKVFNKEKLSHFMIDYILKIADDISDIAYFEKNLLLNIAHPKLEPIYEEYGFNKIPDLDGWMWFFN